MTIKSVILFMIIGAAKNTPRPREQRDSTTRVLLSEQNHFFFAAYKSARAL